MKQDERQVKQQQDEKARGSAELTSAQHSITSQLHPMLGGQTIAALQQPQPATRVSTLHQPMVAVTLVCSNCDRTPTRRTPRRRTSFVNFT